MRPHISVTLTAYNLGPDATEADFDSFAAYVAEHIEGETGMNISVDQFPFANSGHAKDEISGATDSEARAIREALELLWEEWCSESPGGESS